MPTYKINITGIRVGEVNGLPDAIIRVDWELRGFEGAFDTTLPGHTEMDPADPMRFTPFAELTPEQVAGWVEAKESVPGGQIERFKVHIDHVLQQKIIQSQGQAKDMPWGQPEPDTTPPPGATTQS